MCTQSLPVIHIIHTCVGAGQDISTENQLQKVFMEKSVVFYQGWHVTPFYFINFIRMSHKHLISFCKNNRYFSVNTAFTQWVKKGLHGWLLPHDFCRIRIH